MAAPPEDKESTTISFVNENWEHNVAHWGLISPAYRINGYPWRLQISRGYNEDYDSSYSVYLICDKSSEAELWKCNATIKMTRPDYYYCYDCDYYEDDDENEDDDHDIVDHGPEYIKYFEHTFTSWDEDHNSHKIFIECTNTDRNWYAYNFDIATKEDGNSWRLYPVVNFCMYDCILVCGEKKEKIHVNKKFLSSQSPFFDKLFNDDFKEKNMKEILIEDVEGEEFLNLTKLLYRFEGAYLSDQNVHRVVQLANRFELKFVVDRAVSYLLSPSSPLSIADTRLFADQYNLAFLKDNIHARFKNWRVIDLCNSTEFDLLSHDSLQELFNKWIIDYLPFGPSFGLVIQPTSHTPLSKILYNETDTISMVVKESSRESDQFSSTYRIKGFPWRLRIEGSSNPFYSDYVYKGYIICDKSNEAELWKCTAKFECNFGYCMPTLFASWDNDSHEQKLFDQVELRVGTVLEVFIETDDDGESYFRRPSIDPLEPRDGILVFEEEKKIEVNKKSLASQSSYFDRLFFGNFKEKDMKEIPIGDVDYEEFSNLMAVLYGKDDNSTLNCNNAERMLQLADRFELKMVEDRVESFLISSSSDELSRLKKFLIADQFNLPFLKDFLTSQFIGIDEVKEFIKSLQWEQLSKETLRILFKKFCRR